MLNSIKVTRDRMRLVWEINSLPTQVLDELGISRAGLRTLGLSSPKVMKRLTSMANRHHVRQPSFSKNLNNLSDLVERCNSCTQTRACNKFLTNSGAEVEQAAFCPNHAALSELSVMSDLLDQ